MGRAGEASLELGTDPHTLPIILMEDCIPHPINTEGGHRLDSANEMQMDVLRITFREQI